MKRPYRVDALFCKISIDAIVEDEEGNSKVVTVCGSNPEMYEMQFCPYRNLNKAYSLTSYNLVEGLETSTRAGCDKYVRMSRRLDTD